MRTELRKGLDYRRVAYRLMKTIGKKREVPNWIQAKPREGRAYEKTQGELLTVHAAGIFAHRYEMPV